MRVLSKRASPVAMLAVPLLLSLAPSSGSGQTRGEIDRLGEDAVRRTQEYLRINTTNPPGNEALAVEFFARILTAEGIPFDTATSAPGRGNVWARLRGTGSQPALLLLHHMDVVTADPKYWSTDPLGGTITDGHLYGRGALDTKALGIMQLQAFLALHRARVPLERDVIFMATADEEAGGAFGAGWIVKHRPEAFKGAGLLLNEGEQGTLDGGAQTFAIEVTQKVPLWLRLVSVGNPGHGSAPQVSTSVNRLIRALYRVQTYEFDPRVVPAVDAYFKGMAATAPSAWKPRFANLAETIRNRGTMLALQLERPGLAALLRNACSITMLEGSSKINVVPAEAQAQLDCRLLPDQDRDAFLRELAGVINDPGIRIETIMAFTPAVSSTGTPLYRAIERTIRRHFPAATIMPAVQTGFTDSHFFRDLGIASYGFAPILIPAEDDAGVHGNNERISLENIRRGTRMMLEIVKEVAARPAR